jgi:AraC-like DNA-binding protein
VHHVTEANINYYGAPFVHPRRMMKEHDFIYLIDGEWKIGQNDEEFTLTPDTVLILSANNVHYGVSPCAAGTKTMYFHVENIKKGEEKVLLESFIDAKGNPLIKKLFSEIVHHKLEGNGRKADLYFELLLSELNENNVLNGVDVTVKIKNIIHLNPEKFFSNQYLASMAGVSVKTAEYKFKSEYGKTIHQYMLEFKIKEAISYFVTFPEISIKEIAYNLGFYDEYHFSKQFKKITGVSPAEYRKGGVQ